MYNITINGELVQTTMYPNWVRYDKVLQSWCVADSYELAEAILIPPDMEKEREEIYANIEGKPVARAEFPTAVITKVDE